MPKPNTLKIFSSFEEMCSHLDEAVILQVVNAYTADKLKRQKYNKQRQEYIKIAKRLIDAGDTSVEDILAELPTREEL